MPACAENPEGLGTTAFAVLLALGILLSYAPQWGRIIHRRTLEGISDKYLFLMNASAGFMFANIVILSRDTVYCCKDVYSGFHCFQELMGVVQIMMGFLGPSLILVFAVYATHDEERTRLRRLGVCVACVHFFCACCVVWALLHNNYARPTATVFGLMGAAVGCVQYLPQIYTLCRLKHVGSLSIHTMLIQVPGGYLWCASLAMRHDATWSTWITVFMAATLQLVLLVLAALFSYRDAEEVVQVISRSPSRPPSVLE